MANRKRKVRRSESIEIEFKQTRLSQLINVHKDTRVFISTSNEALKTLVRCKWEFPYLLNVFPS